MRKFAYILILAFCIIFFSNARSDNADYDSLLKKSSQELMDEGLKYFEQRQGGNALSRFLIVSERYKESANQEDIKIGIRALNNVGCVYRYLYFDYPEAYNNFTRAYELCKKNKYDSFMPVIMVNLGDILNDYATINKSDSILREAESMFEKCFNLALERKDWELLTTAFFNLSNLNYDIDLKKYNAIFRKDIPESSPDIRFIRLQYLGIQKLQQKKYAESRQYFEQQLDAINTRWEPDRDRISAYLNIAHTYAMEDNVPKQLENLEKALEISEKSDLKDLKANISRLMAESYGKIGDTQRQQKARQLYLETMEEMRDSRLGNIAEMKYLNDLKTHEERVRQHLFRERQQRYVIFAIAIFLLVTILFIIVILKKNRKLHANSQNIYEKYQKLLAAEAERDEHKYSRSNLNDDKREKLIKRIKEILENPENICRQDFSSKELARMVGSNTTYVSQVINETFGVTFSTLLGNYRVKEACRQINESEKTTTFTIEGIANNVGFKSRTALLNAFKREVGLSPSEYIKLTRESQKKEKQ